MVVLKPIPFKGIIRNIWETSHRYKHKADIKLIDEQMEINTNHERILKKFVVENTLDTR